MKKFNSIRGGLACIIIISGLLSSCKKDSGSGGNSMPDPNGSWQVTVIQSGHCSAPAASKLITVTGGNFNATIVTYSAAGCSETLSVSGTITKGNINFIVSGNETLSGNCCVGANGFFNYIDPFQTTIAGNVTSNWGSLRFEKK